MNTTDINYVWKLNTDSNARDIIIDENSSMEHCYLGGVKHFSDLNAETLRRLVTEKFANPEDRQNNSPELGEFLEFGESHEGCLFHGYVVSIDRGDYRVTIDSVSIPAQYSDDIDRLEWKKTADDVSERSGYIELWWD